MTRRLALLLLMATAAWAQALVVSVHPAATQNCCTDSGWDVVITQQGGGDFSLGTPSAVSFMAPGAPTFTGLAGKFTSYSVSTVIPPYLLTQSGIGTLRIIWLGFDVPIPPVDVPYPINPEPGGISPAIISVPVGQPFSQQLAVDGGGTPPFIWGVLPGWGGIPGVTLNSNTGVLSGTISSPTNTTIPLLVSDAGGYVLNQTISFQALNGPVITGVSPNPVIANCCGGYATLDIYGSALDAPNVGTRARYGTGSTTLGLLEVWGEATHLQALFPSTVAPGTYWIEVQTLTTSPRYTIYVTDPLELSTTSLPPGTLDKPYSVALTATGGLAPYSWTVPNDLLPPGLTFDAAAGAISGTPTQTGTYSFPVSVADALQQNASRTLTITITSPLTIQTVDAGHTVVNTPYTVTLEAAGGLPPYRWSVTDGALPPGLALDAATGIISGTPNLERQYTFTVQVTDAARATASRTLVLVVLSQPLSVTINAPDPAPHGQGNVTIDLAGTGSDFVSGTVTLTFTPDPGLPDDPAVRFANGGRSAPFSGQAGSLAPIPLQMGTVAGTITLQATVYDGGIDITPSPAPVRTIRIAPAPPTLISGSLRRTSTGLEVTITGFATSRNVTSATFRFAITAGESLQSPETAVQLNQAFTAWYNDQASTQYGSQFVYTQPFTVQGNTQAITGGTVTLTNAQGTSAPLTLSF